MGDAVHKRYLSNSAKFDSQILIVGKFDVHSEAPEHVGASLMKILEQDE